mmetsp:Transcript_1864/g.171  ORF Transcript_1864/g.171 Transcript_1864/m.171 type:complete len:86 (+) Transcript_1864:146-403(+)
MNSSLFPQSPPVWKGCLLLLYPPLGLFNLKGHKKLLASLKWGPTVVISWIKSSIQLIPNLPKPCSMTWLFYKGILFPDNFPQPLL